MPDHAKEAWRIVAAYDLHPGDKHPHRRGWVLREDLGLYGEPVFERTELHRNRMQVAWGCSAFVALWLVVIAYEMASDAIGPLLRTMT